MSVQETVVVPPVATPEEVENLKKDIAEREVADVLAVKTPPRSPVGSGNESDVSTLSKAPKKKHYQPRIARTRKNMIGKLQELYQIAGKTEVEIRAMNLHRRRKASIQQLLATELEACMNKELEEKTGIPISGSAEQKKEWAVDLLYRFDVTACKLLEKGCEFLPVPVSIDGFANTFTESPQLESEVKSCFREWIEQDDAEWLRELSTPGTRLLMCHFYALASCLKRRPDKNVKDFPDDLPPGAKSALFEAKIRQAAFPYRKRPTLQPQKTTILPPKAVQRIIPSHTKVLHV
jgi:hypothetical protein